MITNSSAPRVAPNSASVAAKFATIVTAMDSLADDLKILCAEARLNSNFDVVELLLDASRELLDVRSRTAVLNAHWSNAGVAAWSLDDITIDLSPRQSKSNQTHLRVFLRSRTIEHRHAKDTFVEVLKMLGFKQVAALGKTVRGCQLVAQSAGSDLYQQEQHDGWYITVHSSTKEKRNMLHEIAALLEEPIKIEVVDS